MIDSPIDSPIDSHARPATIGGTRSGLTPQKKGWIDMTYTDLLNFCFTALIDGGTDTAPITEEEAAYTLQCWQEEENEIAAETAGLTAEEFAAAWNETVAGLTGQAPMCYNHNTDTEREEKTMLHLIFEATPDGNALYTADGRIRAIVPIPENASEDYGYMAMKSAILTAYHGAEKLSFWYDGQENLLDPDAYDGTPTVQIDPDAPKGISIDNGLTWTTPAEALQTVSIETLAEYMDDDAREETAQELAPCTPEAFLTRYLEIAPADLIVG